MTINIDELCNRLAPRFGQIERVESSVVRFTRKSAERPFAVCYVDIAAKLPSSTEALNEYQDRIVGKRFFEGAMSLQWSNYLYFVLPSELANAESQQPARFLIESDRKYARKFVIGESEIDSAIAPPLPKALTQPLSTNILTKWTNILAKAGFDRAILNDETLPRRLELIEQSLVANDADLPSASFVRPAVAQPFLQYLELKRFRTCPMMPRRFDFGRVSLVCGANGTGKTSLLEAIELLYCGKTKRNPRASEDYSLVAGFSDSTTENATQSRSAATFRDRGLSWYGQHEVKNSNLYQSFSQYNFLNTDAAVALAENDDNLEESLSKLLVGPEASKVWREIERTSDKVKDKIKELEALRQRFELELAASDRQIAQSSDVKQESAAIFSKLLAMIERAGWKMPVGEQDDSVKALVESLAELEVLVKQVLEQVWPESPITLHGIDAFILDAEGRAVRADAALARLAVVRKDERSARSSLEQHEALLAKAAELLRVIEAGFPKKIHELTVLESQLAANRKDLSGYSEESVALLHSELLDESVADCVALVAKARTSADEALKEIRKRYAKFTSLRDDAAKLSQQLRDIAAQLLKTAVASDTCPLCHTTFTPGELAKHMHEGVDLAVEAEASRLLAELRSREDAYQKSIKAEAAAKWLVGFGLARKLPASVAVKQIIDELSVLSSAIDSQEAAVDQLRNDIVAANADGMSAERYRELRAGILSHDVSDKDVTADAVEAQSKKCAADAAGDRTTLVKLADEILTLQKTLEETIDVPEADVKTGTAAISGLREQAATAKSLREKLASLIELLPWPADAPVSDLQVTTQSIREIAGDYQTTVTKERSAATLLNEATKKKEQLEVQLSALKLRIDRFQKAQDAMRTILEEHSLQQGTAEALRQNRTAIESIFSRIHAPPEFSGLGSSITTLIRKAGGVEANLQQISTGQRAAFALSLFLAQNAQLRTAPPIVLIDDPIAHIDDLNSLSFLDYLREMVVSGGRQIIFATANDKLASLFERKFDFLGDAEFRRYDLRR